MIAIIQLKKDQVILNLAKEIELGEEADVSVFYYENEDQLVLVDYVG